jgi:hypothetical protein
MLNNEVLTQEKIDEFKKWLDDLSKEIDAEIAKKEVENKEFWLEVYVCVETNGKSVVIKSNNRKIFFSADDCSELVWIEHAQLFRVNKANQVVAFFHNVKKVQSSKDIKWVKQDDFVSFVKWGEK